MVRLYADKNFEFPVVKKITEKGYCILTVIDNIVGSVYRLLMEADEPLDRELHHRQTRISPSRGNGHQSASSRHPPLL
jgi:hypothetical protein